MEEFNKIENKVPSESEKVKCVDIHGLSFTCYFINGRFFPVDIPAIFYNEVVQNVIKWKSLDNKINEL